MNMKRILIFILAIVGLGAGYEVQAQNTGGVLESVYLPAEPMGAQWTYIEYDPSGKPVTRTVETVKSLEGDALNGKIQFHVKQESLTPEEESTEGTTYYCFKDGEFMVDMHAVFEGDMMDIFLDAIEEKAGKEIPEEKMGLVVEELRSHFKVSGQMRGIPRYPQVGTLPDFEFEFKMSIVTMKISGANRKIVGTERIKTEAGEFDCFIMEETVTTKAMMMKDVEKTRGWYAYGVGLVKEISYEKNGKLLSTVVLNDIKWK